MVEAKLYFFQVKIEVTAADTVITFEPGLCIAPEVLDAVDVYPAEQQSSDANRTFSADSYFVRNNLFQNSAGDKI